MSVTVDLKPETEEQLRRKADASGASLGVYLADILQEHVDRGPTLDERLAPARKQFEESGMSEEELDEFFYGIRDEIRRERQAARQD